MSDSRGFDAGDWRVRAHRERAAGSGCGGIRRAYVCVRASVFAIATLIFVGAFGGDAAAQTGIGGGGGGGSGGNNPVPVPAATSDAHRSGQATLFDVGSQFLQRFNAVYSFRTAASAANNPQGGGAEPSAEQRYRTWFEGYGLRSHTDARGDFTGDSRKTYGGVAGVGALAAPGLNLGISVDQSQSIINVAGTAQRGRIDLTQVGAIAAYESGPWNINATLVHGFADVHSSRVDLGGASTAAYQAGLWAAMAEVNYYWALPDNTRLVPKLTFDWMRTYTDAFTEIGGTTPISGSAVTASRIRMLIGGELGHSWLVDRRIMDASVYARFVDNLSQNFGALQISDTTGVNLPAFVAGIRESTLGADAGAALSAKVTDVMRLYIVYDGRFRSNLTSHSGTVGAEFRW
jgi:uncharacterized protein with beta-barrel porin domain